MQHLKDDDEKLMIPRGHITCQVMKGRRSLKGIALLSNLMYYQGYLKQLCLVSSTVQCTDYAYLDDN